MLADSLRYDQYNLRKAHDPYRGRRNGKKEYITIESNVIKYLLYYFYLKANGSTLELSSFNQSDEEINKNVVRLVDGFSSSEGRVEIKIDGLWNTICDSNWRIDKANAVCNLLGFSGALDLFHEAFFGVGNGSIRTIDNRCFHLDKVSNLSCLLSSEINKNCSHANDVGVICFRKYIQNIA